MVKCVSILGSTGSIGRQSLDVISRLPEIRVAALTAGSNVERMAQQCREFRPILAVMSTQETAEALKNELSDMDITVMWGEEGLIRAASIEEADCDYRSGGHGGLKAYSGGHPGPKADRSCQ